MKFEVTVHNVGTVYHGDDRSIAVKTFNEFVELSNRHLQGRASGESVFLFWNDEIIAEYKGDGMKEEG